MHDIVAAVAAEFSLDALRFPLRQFEQFARLLFGFAFEQYFAGAGHALKSTEPQAAAPADGKLIRHCLHCCRQWMKASALSYAKRRRCAYSNFVSARRKIV